MGKKKPAFGAQPPGPGPRYHANPDQFGSARPVWRFSLMEMQRGAPWSWRDMALDDLLNVQMRLAAMEKCELGRLHETRSHTVQVHQLARSAQRRLEEKQLDDIDDLYSLRITGRQRVWAIQDRNVFELLWWDPEHEVCPSNAKDN